MKKIFNLTAILLFSTTVSATTIELSGLDKIKASNVDMLFQGYVCETYWDCGVSEIAFGISPESIPMRMKTVNSKIRGRLLTKDYKGVHSTFFLKFSGYPNACNVILTYKNNVNIILSEDGSCQSN